MEQKLKAAHSGAKAVPHRAHTEAAKEHALRHRVRHQMTLRVKLSFGPTHHTVAYILHSLELCQTDFFKKL